MQITSLKKSNIFISYGRAESKAFAARLYDRLKKDGKEIWFDQNDIPLGIDFQDQINDGIEKAENFIFIIAPHAIHSEYCLKEIKLAIKRNKRIIPILHIEPENKKVWDKLHPVISKLNWIYMRQKKDDSKSQEQWEYIDDFDRGYASLLKLLDKHPDYVSTHNELLTKALRWERNLKNDKYLLNAEEHKQAKEWMLTKFTQTLPPCEPTDLHCVYICESEEKLSNGHTCAFFSYAREDKLRIEQVKLSLARQGITTWADTSDIKIGAEFRESIRKGVIEADHFLFFISPHSVTSEYCLMELKWAKKYHKNIIPLYALETPEEQIPLELRTIQYIDFTDNVTDYETRSRKEKSDYDKDIDDLMSSITKDAEYYRTHKEVLIKSLDWEIKNYPTIELLHGFDLEKADKWLKDNEKRAENRPTSVQRKFIHDSLTSRISAFISYGRKHSLDFASKLHNKLNAEGYNVWFDQNDIPLGVDFQAQIDSGIENADNFIFIISPHSIKSVYCLKEIILAINLNKRIIPILHIEPSDCWEKMHPIIQKLNWIYFQEKVNDFDESFNGLTQLMQSHADYVKKHTQYLTKALEWNKNQKNPSFLIVGNERQESENWLKTQFKKTQPPCIPTELHDEYICESKKNANNMMTDIFFCYAREDFNMKQKIKKSLNHHGITTWSDMGDISKGSGYSKEINKGIEQADNFIFLISPKSISSEYCIKEFKYVKTLNKRIIPVLLAETDLSSLPIGLGQLQYVDFSDVNIDEQSDTLEKTVLLHNIKEKIEHDVATRKGTSKFEKHFGELLIQIEKNREYHHQHKIFLCKAIKWKKQNNNPSILLRGYNLQNGESWIKIGKTRTQHKPIDLQESYIVESRANASDTTTEVFISYSRANSDFARKLNNELQTQQKTTWFDQESIASGSDFAAEINKGIETSDNFVFVITSHSIKSPYCDMEVEHAKKYNKRFITILYEEVDIEDIHKDLAAVQWIDFRPDEVDFHSSFTELLQTLDTDREHVQHHTKWLQRAKEWQQKNKPDDLLLRGTAFNTAEDWLAEAVELKKTPAPTDLQKDYIAKSREAVIAAQRREKQQKIIVRMMFVMAVLIVIAIGFGITAFRLSKIAEDKAEEALILKTKAEAAETEAKKLKLLAEASADTAMQEKEKAFEAKLVAEELKKEAEKSAITAQVERDKARKAEAMAQRLKDEALKAKDNAVESEKKAIVANDYSIFKLYEFNALNFANKSVQMQTSDDTKELKALLALTAFELKKEASQRGKKLGENTYYDPELLESLQKAALLYENGNLMKAQAWTMDAHKGKIAFSDTVGSLTISELAISNGPNLPTLKSPRKISFLENDFVFDMAYNNSGNKIACGMASGNVILCDTKSNTQNTIYIHNSNIKSLSFAPNKDLLVTTDDSRNIWIYDIKKKTIIKQLTYTTPLSSIVINKSNNVIGTGANGEIVIIDIGKSAAPQYAIKSGKYKFSELSYNNNLDWLIAGTTKGKLLRIKLNKDNFKKNKFILLPKTHSGGVSNITVSPDNKWLATASYDGTIMLWNLTDVKTKGVEKLVPITIDNKQKVYSIAFDNDSKYMLYSDNKNIHLCPLDVNIIYDKLRNRIGNKKLTEEQWNYYKRGDLKKP